MDKWLKPSRFDCDPSSAGAEKEWKHWERTFQNFIATLDRPASGSQAAVIATSEQKLSALVNFVSLSVYDYIADADNYDTAIAKLRSLYIKPNNVLYNRHLLATRRQSEAESVDQYVQSLEKLSKNCEFKQVDAETYRKEYIRDSFISGLHSGEIRRCLLENNDLTLDKTHQTARALELAHKHSAEYVSTTNLPFASNSAAASSAEISQELTGTDSA